MKSYIYNNRLAGALLLSLNLSLALSSCDTVEEGYHVGTEKDVILYTSSNELGTDTLTQLPLAADGLMQEFYVISNVNWDFQNMTDDHFKISYNKHLGSTKVQVSADPNLKEKTITEDLLINVPQFNKTKTIELAQPKIEFSMEPQEFEVAPEQGAGYTLTFNSTIAWRFEIKEYFGDIRGFVSPMLYGEGEWGKINIDVYWEPNYTTEPRYIVLELMPADEKFKDYVSPQEPVEFRQEPGTLPCDISLSQIGEPTYHAIPLAISYKSNAPIDTLGVYIEGSEQRFVAPLQEGESYPQSGSFNFTVDGLDENTTYTFTPFVISKVGESTGESIQVRTDGDIIFEGPQLIGLNIDPYPTDVTASFEIESDVMIQSIIILLRDDSDDVIAEQVETINDNYANIYWDRRVPLEQNSDYFFDIKIEFLNPNTKSVEVYELAPIPFRTTIRTPQEGDNRPID